MIYRSCLFVLAGFLLPISALYAQNDTTALLTESEIIRQVEEITRELVEITSELNQGRRLTIIQSVYEEGRSELERYLQAGNEQVATSGVNRLQDFILIMQRQEEKLDLWQDEILELSQSLNEDELLIRTSLLRIDSIYDQRHLLPEMYQGHLQEVREQLLQTRDLVNERKEGLIDLQIQIAGDYVRVLKRLAVIRDYRERYWQRLFAADTTVAPFETMTVNPLGTTVWRILRFFRVNPLNSFFFLLLIAGIYYVLHLINRKDAGQKFDILYKTRLPTSFMLGFLLFPLIFPPTTTLMYNFMLVMAYVPFVFILRHPPFQESFKTYLLFTITFLVIRVSGFLAPLISAFILEMIYLAAAVIFLAFMLNKKQYRAFNPRWRIARGLLWLLKILLVIAVIYYFTDRKILAKILIESVADTLALGMVILYIGFWMDTLIDFLRERPGLKHLQSADSTIGWRKWQNFSRMILLTLFLVAFAHYLHIDDVIADTVSEFLGAEREIGSLVFTWGGILLFFLVLFISSKLAGWIKFFTSGKAIYGSEKRTGTIGAMVRFGVILAGFLLALFVSGIPLDKITIILGALSVGLGFGLQNIVNNLVSGIILIFERPIQVGDMVNVKTYTGIVKDISIRASIVKTFDGAEVIIPNGHLISEEVINWTLSDQHRRVEVIVGVAYGSDVEKVKTLFEELLSDFKGILKLPKPMVLFQEFGDSSLNFSLRFWVSNIDDWLQLKSDITTAVYHILKEAGIEIPFPQRDLHVKSISAADLRKALDTTGRK